MKCNSIPKHEHIPKHLNVYTSRKNLTTLGFSNLNSFHVTCQTAKAEHRGEASSKLVRHKRKKPPSLTSLAAANYTTSENSPGSLQSCRFQWQLIQDSNFYSICSEQRCYKYSLWCNKSTKISSAKVLFCIFHRYLCCQVTHCTDKVTWFPVFLPWSSTDQASIKSEAAKLESVQSHPVCRNISHNSQHIEPVRTDQISGTEPFSKRSSRELSQQNSSVKVETV